MRKPVLNPLLRATYPKRLLLFMKNQRWMANAQRQHLTFRRRSVIFFAQMHVGWVLNRSKMSMQITPCTNWCFNACRAGCSHRILLACLSPGNLNAETGSVPKYIFTFAHALQKKKNKKEKTTFLRISLVYWIAHLAIRQEAGGWLQAQSLMGALLPQFPSFLSPLFF